MCDEYLSNEMVSKVVEKECKYDVFIINKLFIVMLMWYGNVNYEDARLKRWWIDTTALGNANVNVNQNT